MEAKYIVKPIKSTEAVAYYVDYIPLTPEVSDLYGLLIKHYTPRDNNIYISSIGIRLNPSKRMAKHVPFPTRQYGLLVTNGSGLEYHFGDAWEGIIIRGEVNPKDLKFITILANQLLLENAKKLNA